MNRKVTCFDKKIYYGISLLVLMIIILADISTTKFSFNSEFKSLFLYAFGGIDINVINRKIVVRYIFIAILYLFLLFSYIEFVESRNYMLLLRFRDRKKFLNYELKKIFIFTSFFCGSIVILYFILGILFLKNNGGYNSYINIIYNRQVIVDYAFLLKSIALYYFNMLYIGIIAFTFKLILKKLSLEYLAPLTLILVSIYSKNGVLRWVPSSVAMAIRIDYITGNGNGMNFISSFTILIIFIILVFMLLNYIISKVQII